MKSIMIFAFVVLLPIGSPIMEDDERVFGGKNAKEGQFPYLAMIMNFKVGYSGVQYQICGGTIISKRRIATAAHCVYHGGKINSPREIFVGVGTISTYKITKGYVIHRIRRIIVHEDYKTNRNKDIALLETKLDIEFGPLVSKLPIASDSSVFEDGKNCVIVGWGRQICSELSSIPPIAQYANVKILGHEDCSFFSSRVDSDIICAGLGLPKNSVGDSGGPLICNESFTGIVSSGPKCNSMVFLPVHFANVYANEKWILNPTTFYGFSQNTKKATVNLGIFFLSLTLFIFVFLKTCSPAKKSGFATKFLTTF